MQLSGIFERNSAISPRSSSRPLDGRHVVGLGTGAPWISRYDRPGARGRHLAVCRSEGPLEGFGVRCLRIRRFSPAEKVRRLLSNGLAALPRLRGRCPHMRAYYPYASSRSRCEGRTNTAAQNRTRCHFTDHGTCFILSSRITDRLRKIAFPRLSATRSLQPLESAHPKGHA